MHIDNFSPSIRGYLMNDPYFGRLNVATIIDYYGHPGNATAILRSVSDRLCHENVDLIVTNVTPGPWETALKRNGFLQGPSNFAVGFSPKIAATVGNRIEGFHITRADGHYPEAQNKDK